MKVNSLTDVFPSSFAIYKISSYSNDKCFLITSQQSHCSASCQPCMFFTMRRFWSEPESCWELCSRGYYYEEFQSPARLEPAWSLPWIQERADGYPAVHG